MHKLTDKVLVTFLAIWICISGALLNDAYSKELQIKKETAPEENQTQQLEEKWGIKILSIRLTANGYMLDFRYKVNDTERASPLFERKIKPYLIDQTTGAKFLVPESPKVGALRQTRKPMANKNYFMIFANPGKYVKKGCKVTIIAGDFKAENLIVQ